MDPSVVPSVVFIVPYRNREAQLALFCHNWMRITMDNRDKYLLLVVEQKDDREFNRGAMKNIGFLWVKQIFPEHYKDITLVFNDVDTLPAFANMFSYETSRGVIKHFYGLKGALGGIFAITGYDFEIINGFPNYWGWGMEDTVLLRRYDAIADAVKNHNKTAEPDNKMFVPYIDYSEFREVDDPNVLVIFHGFTRTLDKIVDERAKCDDGSNGIATLTNVNINQYSFPCEYIKHVEVTEFDTEYPELACEFVTAKLI